MKCANCSFVNEGGAAFCESCGAPLRRTCPKCRAQLNPTARFCNRCGTEQPLTEQRPTLEGARKSVTILFADIVGSTSLAEKFDPEDWKEIVNDAHRIVSRAVDAYGGTIAQLLGDGVLAFFGAPVTHEDDPIRAIRAALDIQSGMEEYGRKLEGRVDNWKMRIGLNTGLVVTGTVGSDSHMEYLAIGDSVNIAARLQSAARPGSILISQSTYRPAAHAAICVDLGEIEVKGKMEPVRAYEVERLAPRPESPRGLPGLHSAMLGRNAELDELQRATRRVRAGTGGVALIVGEPGLGKSRLVAEWKSKAAGQVHWAEGQSLSYGQGAAYHLVTELLRSLLEINPGAEESESNERLQQFTGELFGELAPEISLHLAQLLWPNLEGEAASSLQELDPQTLRSHYVAALRRLLLAYAARDPLILILEDVHWADPSSTDLLIGLLPLVNEAPILFCLTTRPDSDTPGWKLVAAAREAAGDQRVDITLVPLSQSDRRQLVSNLLDVESLPEAVRSRILAKTEGNPFFVEEVVRMLIDRGGIARKEGAWVARDGIAEIDIPDSLQALLLARIDRLVDELKRTLRVASVIGRQFSFGILERVLGNLHEGAQGRKLENDLEALGDSGLVRQLPNLEELEYLFRHALVQEAAYQATLKSDRRILHRAVGEAIEFLFPKRIEKSALLAFHYERGEDWTRALQWSQRAADHAFAQMALPEATDLNRHALAALLRLPKDPQAEFELRFKLARCMMMTGVPREETLPEFERALALTPDSQRQAEVHFRIGELFHIYTSSDLDLAESHYNEALRLLGDEEPTELYCTVLGYLGYLYRYQRKTARAAELLERALGLALKLGATRISARVLYFLSGAYLDLGHQEESLSAGLRGLGLAERLGDLELIGMAHSFLADIYLQRASSGEGSVENALPHIQEMRRHGREYGVSPLAGFGAAGLAEYYQLKGDRDAAFEAWKEGARVWSAAGALRRAIYCRANEGRLLLEKGETEQALRVFSQAQEAGGTENSSYADLWIGLAYAGAGQETQAVARLESAFSSEGSSERRIDWLNMIQTDPDLSKERSLTGISALLERVQAQQA